MALLVLMLETARTQVPGEPTSASPGSPVAPTCSNYTACKACATQEGCGWCTYSTECMPGNANGSTSGTCVDWSYVWMYEPAQCPLSSPFPSLCTSKPCSDCATTALCGWCDTTCVPGTQNGPYYGACEKGWYYSHCPVVLARNVWWLWSMFALLMVCVIITVRSPLAYFSTLFCFQPRLNLFFPSSHLCSGTICAISSRF